jgi:hypothetical protein
MQTGSFAVALGIHCDAAGCGGGVDTVFRHGEFGEKDAAPGSSIARLKKVCRTVLIE